MEKLKSIVNDLNEFKKTLIEDYENEQALNTTFDYYKRLQGNRELSFISIIYKGKKVHDELITSVDDEYHSFDKISCYCLGFWQGARMGVREC